MMLLRSQSVSYFNVKFTIWLKGYQNDNHIKPSEQQLQEISIAKNWPHAGFKLAAFGFPVHCLTLKYDILWLHNNIIVTSQKPNYQLKLEY